MSEDGDNIIHLPLDLDRSLAECDLDWRNRSKCKHARISIDRSLRKVLCRTCEEEIDAIDCLAHIARARESYAAAAKISREEQEEAEKELDALKKEIARERAKLREATREDPVEQFKAEVLDRIAKAADRVLEAADPGTTIHHASGTHVEPGEPGELERRLIAQLEAAELVAQALVGGEASERFRRKIKAAVEELDARRRRKSIRIVPQQKRDRRPRS